MLYSADYIYNGKDVRFFFYAEDDTEAQKELERYAERVGRMSSFMALKKHPHGCYLPSERFPRFLPAKQKRRKIRDRLENPPPS